MTDRLNIFSIKLLSENPFEHTPSDRRSGNSQVRGPRRVRKIDTNFGSWGCSQNYISYPISLTLIRESRKSSPKRGTVTERVFRKKSRAQHCIICICFRALDYFFRKARSITVPKMAYIFVQHGIFPLILAYAI